ncbi:hypothetical protein Barb6_00895 [Bacteroidales bacterium Barb6]|nr:hypothetical protein Barb6_00895 [Bacteroidales bacterium Barb6]
MIVFQPGSQYAGVFVENDCLITLSAGSFIMQCEIIIFRKAVVGIKVNVRIHNSRFRGCPFLPVSDPCINGDGQDTVVIPCDNRIIVSEPYPGSASQCGSCYFEVTRTMGKFTPAVLIAYRASFGIRNAA